MRKTYIAPQMMVVQTRVEGLIAASMTGYISDEEFSDDAGVKECANPFGSTIFDEYNY